MKRVLRNIVLVLIVVAAVIFLIWHVLCRGHDGEPIVTGLMNGAGEATSNFQYHDSVMFQAVDLEPRTVYVVRIVGPEDHVEHAVRLVTDKDGRIPETVLWYNVGARTKRASAALNIILSYTVEIALPEDNGVILQIPFWVQEQLTRPVLYAADADGNPKSGFLIGEENVWVVGKQFPRGSMIRLWAVPAKSLWKEGDRLKDKTGQFGLELPPLFVLKGEKTEFKRMFWSKYFTSLGSYDIVAEVVTYDFGTYRPQGRATVQNVVSHLTHSGFVVQRRAGAGEHLEMELSGTRKSPYTFRDTFLTDEDVYVGVDPCVQPSKLGDAALVWIVKDKNEAQWTQHVNTPSDLLDDDDVTGGPTAVTVGGVCGNCWNQLAWPAPIRTGKYDIVLDFDQDKRYTPGVDLIDGLDRAGFSVSEIRVDSIDFSPGSDKIVIYHNISREKISGPEYEAKDIVNKPVAWTMGVPHSVEVTFKGASTINTAQIWAESGLGGLASDGSPVAVTFSNGSGSGRFPVNRVPEAIGKHKFFWAWRYKTSSSANPKEMGVTGEHKIYTVFDTPRAPMKEPWWEVLEYACNWANGETSASGVSSKIVQRMYDSGIRYHGFSEHYTYPHHETFYLNQLFSDLRTPGFTVYMDCRDCANFFLCLTNALGFNDQYMVIKSEKNQGFRYKSLRPIGHSWCNGDIWNFHQVGWCGSMVADSSVKLNCPEPYVQAACDLTAEEYFAYLSDTTLKGTQFGVCRPKK